MRAPVYRHIEMRNSLGGLSLNGFIAILGVALAAIQTLSFAGSLLVVSGTYTVLLLAGSGRPPLYWQHLFLHRFRQYIAGGRHSSVSRSSSPQFLFSPDLHSKSLVTHFDPSAMKDRL